MQNTGTVKITNIKTINNNAKRRGSKTLTCALTQELPIFVK